MNLRSIFNFGKSALSTIGSLGNKSVRNTAVEGIKRWSISNINKSAFKKFGKVAATSIGAGIGGATGGLAGALLSNNPLAAIGGMAGGVIGGGILARSAIKFPKAALIAGTGATLGYSLLKPLIGPQIMAQDINRPTNPAIRTTSSGPGFVSMGNSGRIRIPPNNLGATGDLTLSMYKLRHGRN